MTSEERIISEANKYVMPAIEDYLGARCLLLNNIFVGLTLAHETVEKIIKALLVLEKIRIPKSCHELTKLTNLLTCKDSSKYKLLIDNLEFIERLDKHYAWRYYDGDIVKRSQDRSPRDLTPLDILWVALHDIYMDFLPEQYRFRTYFLNYLFSREIAEYTNWSMILSEDNTALGNKVDIWREEYEKIFYKSRKIKK